jgi:lysophospholipase L1-like esterase
MIRLALAAALCLLSIAPVAAHAAGRHDGSLTDPDIRYVGRWDQSNSSEYHSYWCAPYLRVGFTGTSVKIRLAESTSLNVSIDGAAPRTMPAGAGETALNSSRLAPGRHTLLVGGEGQNEEVRLLGLTLDPGASTFAVPARPLIEFVGDSITVIDGAGNYSWLTGEMLGCDHTQIAFSGVALTSGYGCVSKVGQDVQFFRLKNYNHAADSPPAAWDFSYTPQIVVINLGQNDQCGSESNDTLTASYESFVRHLRARFPQAQIAALRPFGGPYEASIRQAVETIRAAGDVRVYYIDTTGWLGKDDYRDGIHPTALGNVKVVGRLAPLLKPLL